MNTYRLVVYYVRNGSAVEKLFTVFILYGEGVTPYTYMVSYKKKKFSLQIRIENQIPYVK